MRPATYHKYTQAELDYIRDHCHEKARDVHAVVGGKFLTVRSYMEKFKNGRFMRTKGTPHYYYAIYLRKTDELVASGSAKECMEQLDITRNAFYSLACRSRKGETKKWEIYVEPYKEVFEQ